jgi:hypothetical protein
MNLKKTALPALIVAGAMTAATPIMARGLVADIFVRPFSPKLADRLDEENRKLKDANPLYKSIEEGASATVRNTIRTLPDRVLFRGRY